MRKVIWAATLMAGAGALAGCHRRVEVGSPPQPVSSQPATGAMPSNLTGAPDAESAVRAFLAAAKAQDLQAFGSVWGTDQGPARESMDRDELEKREIYLLKCLAHDSYRILSSQPGTDARRIFSVELRRQALTRTANFYSVPGPSNRWYVENFDIVELQDFCVGG